MALNQLINVAVAEKVSDVKKALQMPKRAGNDDASVPGDELPPKTTRRRR